MDRMDILSARSPDKTQILVLYEVLPRGARMDPPRAEPKRKKKGGSVAPAPVPSWHGRIIISTTLSPLQFEHQTCFTQAALVRCSLTCVDLTHFTLAIVGYPPNIFKYLLGVGNLLFRDPCKICLSSGVNVEIQTVLLRGYLLLYHSAKETTALIGCANEICSSVELAVVWAKYCVSDEST